MSAQTSPTSAPGTPEARRRPTNTIASGLGLALVVLVSACGESVEATGSPSTTPEAVTDQPSVASSPTTEEATPEPSLDPDPIALFTCGTTPPFAGALLTLPAGAESSTDPAAEALHALLAEEAANAPEGATSLFHASGWWRVARSGTTASFVARSEVSDQGFVSATFTVTEGAWRPSQWGECTPQPALPAGLGLGAWRIDGEPPAPEARTISALVTEMACASGESSEGRILPPEVSYGPDSILVVFAVRGLDGAQTCQGNPSAEYTIELREPVGDRTVLDGSQLPPRDATTCPAVQFDCDRP